MLLLSYILEITPIKEVEDTLKAWKKKKQKKTKKENEKKKQVDDK
jgi:hypothetical protein